MHLKASTTADDQLSFDKQWVEWEFHATEGVTRIIEIREFFTF